jgi:hypothetical protein
MFAYQNFAKSRLKMPKKQQILGEDTLRLKSPETFNHTQTNTAWLHQGKL